MPILPAWNGEGSLPDSEVLRVAEGEREGWASLRSLQGDPMIDVVRYTVTDPGDPARGVKSTREPVADLDGLPVLWGNLTEREAREVGFVSFADGDRRFEFFTDVELFTTDLLRFPSSTGNIWKVLHVYYDDHIGQTIAFARLSKGSA